MQTVHIVVKSDVCLVTTAEDGQGAGFLVDSRILSYASPTLAALLGPNFPKDNRLAEQTGPATAPI